MLHQIGAGALGPVFRAYEPDRDRLVAIKLFRLDLPPERAHQLVGELERLVAAGVTHAGIAAPLAAGIDGNVPYLVQEFSTADSLDIVVRDYGPAPPADALRLAVQFAGALDFAAGVNVEHGSLHPRDVLLSTDDVRMTGLGVGRALERVGGTAPVRRPYTAPERMLGPGWDRRADIFSLAVLLHEMLWGRRIAGTGRQAADALTDLAGADLGALRRTFGRALAENPADRFPTALEFAAALQDAFAVTNQKPPIPEPRLPLDGDIPPIVIAEPEIREAEAERYLDIESAPALGAAAIDPPVERAPFRTVRPIDMPLASPTPSSSSGLLRSFGSEPPSGLDEPHSAMWPLALALVVGLALGFGAGYALGSANRGVTLVPSVAAPAVGQKAPSGREFTEGAVSEPPRPTATPAPATVPAASPAPAPEVSRSPEVTGAVAGAPRSKPAPAPGAPVESGRLVVRSTPAGARVFVDGRDLGRTPATIRDLARGSHSVRLVYEGYATEERRVVVTPTSPAPPVIIVMTRTRAAAPTPARPAPAAGPFVGALSVDSRPAGANVFLDGKLIGTTPLMLPEVSAGEHLVRIEYEGYRRWSAGVRVVSGERNRVTASLEK